MGKKKFNHKNEIHEAKKKYGQNFLEDSELSEKIIEVSGISKDTEVIEIGPGLGFLTGKLIEKSKYLMAFEIDDDLIPVFNKNIKVVANIPYYITSPIINKLIEYRKNISEIYLMVQKEVAERIASEAGSRNMSLLTHAVQFYADAEYLFTVPKEKFIPVPKVDSAFLKIKMFDDERYEKQISEEEYFKYLKTAFSNKRKSIANNLSGEGYSKEVTGDILEKLGKTRLARTEEFSVQEFINLIDELKK